MHLNDPDHIIRQADRIVKKTGSRSAEHIAAERGLTIIEVPFKKQKGVYRVIERNRYIFLKEDLQPVMRDIVILHEVGHDVLHRRQAVQFQEFNLFDMANNRMEYEANLFAAQIMLPDEEILEYIYLGYDAQQIARIMNSDINLVALKGSDLIRRGYSFRDLEHKNDFLAYRS